MHRSALAARYINTLGGVRVLCGQQGVRAPVAAAVAGSRLINELYAKAETSTGTEWVLKITYRIFFCSADSVSLLMLKPVFYRCYFTHCFFLYTSHCLQFSEVFSG